MFIFIDIFVPPPEYQHECDQNNFVCDNKHCIPNEFVCNGLDDCDDNSDEMNCDKTSTIVEEKECNEDEFSCPSEPGLCLPLSSRYLFFF